MSQNNNNGNIQWKNLGIVFLGLMLLWLVFNQLVPATNTYGWSGHMGSGYMGTYFNSPGINLQGLLVSLLLIALKVLWIVFLIGLLMGLWLVVKKYLNNEGSFNGFDLNPLIDKFRDKKITCPSCHEKLQEEFKFCPKCKASLKNVCTKCGKELLADWKCCPCCGTNPETKTETKTVTKKAKEE